MKFLRRALRYLLFFACFFPVLTFGQSVTGNTTQSASNSIVVGITPDSRSGALGDAGVALSPDVNATYWNPSKLAFIDKDGASFSYNPWLQHLVPDVSMAYLSYAHRLNERNSIGLSMRYFNMGTIQLVDESQQSQGTFTPNQFAIDGSFARKFGDNFSMGLTMRYIHATLVSNTFERISAGAVAADVSLYYFTPVDEFGKGGTFAFGTNISNIGTKISYTATGERNFLPTNLKIGAANTWNLDENNDLTLLLDFNKLLVPAMAHDSKGNVIPGSTDNISVPAGIFRSFSDTGFSGELQELSIGGGLEYWYNKQFSLRGGYYYSNPHVDGRKYFTLGAGFKYDIFDLDFSYIAAPQQDSPLANTLRFTLSATFGHSKK